MGGPPGPDTLVWTQFLSHPVSLPPRATECNVIIIITEK